MFQFPRNFLIRTGAAAILMSVAAFASAQTVVSVLKLDSKGVGTLLGTVTVSETPYGLVFTPNLKGLPEGQHGFHLHENGSCEPAEKDGKMVPGLAAGGHYDPHKTGKHGAPWGDGHLGDLPALYVDGDGKATTPVLAPRVKTSDLKGRALMIHAGGDNYSDHPSPLGGGGARMACGVIQ
ncbi:superoxide dismutase [Cu-Zn] SodC [Microbulbifer harenosus]|uniref:Superoxide dismutase [Cu-Zn] n=1 Tax=Microbulbifer harenosus TaxID=2576840 RepID=A0ABY2UCV7_9GAMM|nr:MULTISPECIES: superoxide dismutase family protein [Microbulbifer]QIL89627.1 superoxide dismutase [Cu-Zn] SodC2 [Microbulbifer sp. SH-1]TLM73935.1 superoxide dismutase family protein [Microbulbifer harenosus]